MRREEILNKLSEIFIDVFDDDSIRISDSTNSSDIDEWDSLMHITLMGVIEDEFNVKFAIEELSKMKNVGTMIDIIQEHI